jgi:predicted transporter
MNINVCYYIQKDLPAEPWLLTEGDFMKRQKALRIVNPVLFLLISYQGVTGIFNEQMYNHFQAVHPIVGILLLFVAAVHLALNWSWVKSQVSRRSR